MVRRETAGRVVRGVGWAALFFALALRAPQSSLCAFWPVLVVP